MTTNSDAHKTVVERREAVRADREMAVRHRLIKRNGRNNIGDWNVSTTKNMSIGGLLFASPFFYHVGDTVELEVVMSGMIDIFKGQATVVRVSEVSGDAFDVAAKYVEVKFKPRSAKKHLKS